MSKDYKYKNTPEEIIELIQSRVELEGGEFDKSYYKRDDVNPSIAVKIR